MKPPYYSVSYVIDSVNCCFQYAVIAASNAILAPLCPVPDMLCYIQIDWPYLLFLLLLSVLRLLNRGLFVLVDVLLELLDTLKELREVALAEPPAPGRLLLGLAILGAVTADALDDFHEDGGPVTCDVG